MISIYEVGSDGLFTGQTRMIQVEPDGEDFSGIEGIPPTWTDHAPPATDEEHVARRMGQEWIVVARPQPSTDPEPAPRYEIPKSTVSARVKAAGKWPQAWAMLQSDPEIFDRWYTPDWPNVLSDDPTLLEMVAALGLDPDEILAPA